MEQQRYRRVPRAKVDVEMAPMHGGVMAVSEQHIKREYTFDEEDVHAQDINAPCFRCLNCSSFWTWPVAVGLAVFASLMLTNITIWGFAVYCNWWVYPRAIELFDSKLAGSMALLQNIFGLFISRGFDAAGEAVGLVCDALTPLLEVVYPDLNCTKAVQATQFYLSKYEAEIALIMHNVTQAGWEAALGSTSSSSVPYLAEQLSYLAKNYPYEGSSSSS